MELTTTSATTTINVNEYKYMDELELQYTLRKDRNNIRTFDDLISFLHNVKENCNTGYGQSATALAQATLATAYFLSSEFRITGFQASFAMWGFIREWNYSSNKCGLKLIDYDNMLYPQYENNFENTIDKYTFEQLQKTASELLKNSKTADKEVIKHWESIVNGKIPFGYILKDI